MTCLAPGRKRKGAKVIKGVAPELDGPGIGHAATIQNIVCFGKPHQEATEQPTGLNVLYFPFSETTPACWRWGGGVRRCVSWASPLPRVRELQRETVD